MERTPVKSSNVKAIGYDADNKVLEVEFHNGGLYQYKQVPKLVYNRLMTAESIGKAFVSSIKPKFDCTRLDRNPDLMPCGHHKTDVVSSDEGTSFCAKCEQEARAGGVVRRRVGVRRYKP